LSAVQGCPSTCSMSRFAFADTPQTKVDLQQLQPCRANPSNATFLMCRGG
jgi:hypothetical protein